MYIIYAKIRRNTFPKIYGIMLRLINLKSNWNFLICSQKRQLHYLDEVPFWVNSWTIHSQMLDVVAWILDPVLVKWPVACVRASAAVPINLIHMSSVRQVNWCSSLNRDTLTNGLNFEYELFWASLKCNSI